MISAALSASATKSCSHLLPVGLAGVAYFMLAAGTILLTSRNGSIPTFWPANAVLLAMMLLCPRRRWPSILMAGFLANIAANVVTRGSMVGPLLFGLSNLVEVVIAAVALRTARPNESLLDSPGDVGRFLLWGGLTAPMLSALCGAATAWSMFDQPFLQAFLTWYAADALGLLIFTPFLFALFGGGYARWLAQKNVGERVEAAALLLLTAGLAFLVFRIERPALFLLFGPVILVTFRLGRLGTKCAVLIIALTGMLCTVNGYGPIAGMSFDTAIQAFFLQFFLAGLLLIALPVAATLSIRRALYERLLENEQGLRALAASSADVLMNFDRNGACRSAIGATAAMLDSDADTLVGRRVDDLAPGGIVRGVHNRALKSPDKWHHVEFRPAGGETRWLEAAFRAVLDDQHHPLGTIATIRDITTRKLNELALEHSAMTDSLTGLHNRAGLMARLRAALEQQGAGGISLAMIDLDHFKHVNDGHGHRAGDAVLKELAARMRAEVRGTDVLARLGGDEFVIMFSAARDRGIVDICGRIATAVDSRPIALPDGGSVHVSISCGIALHRPGISAEALLHEADLSLYQAKRAGRNRVILSRAA